MLEEAHALPDDIAALKAMVLASRAKLAARDAELRDRDLLIEKLKHQLAGLRRQRFGATSEALDQLELGLEDEEIARAAEAPPEPTPATKTQPKRRPLPDHLPREEMVLAPADRCITCGGRLKRLGEDVHRRAGVRPPGRFVVKRIVPSAPGLRRLRDVPPGAAAAAADRARAVRAPGFWAHVLVSKYCDHLPLYRQSRIFARDGVELDRSTLAGWGRQGDGAAGAPGRCHRAPRAGPAGPCSPTTPRSSCWAPGTGKTATGRGLDLRPGRAALGWRGAAGGMVPLLGRPQGGASEGAS